MATADPADQAPYEALTTRERRRVVGEAALRMLVSIAVLVAAFIVIPPADLATRTLGTSVLVALVLLVGVVVWEIRRVIRDPYPEVRAATGIIVVAVAVILVFAIVYAAMSAGNAAAFTEPLDKSNAIYFTVTTASTTGFGDITAASESARWVVTAQMLIDLIVIVGVARVFVLAAKVSRARRDRADSPS